MEEEDFAACFGAEFVSTDAAVGGGDIAGAGEEVGWVDEGGELGWGEGLEGTGEDGGAFGRKEAGVDEVVEDCDEGKCQQDF